MQDQSSGRAAKDLLVFIYHPIPFMGFFHLPCIAFKALLCISSPPATISLRWLSSALITASAVFPWNATSHGPPICLHVIVFIFMTSLKSVSLPATLHVDPLTVARRDPSHASRRTRR